MIEGQEQLKAYITSYYKGLFGAPAEDILSMDETRTEDIPQVSNEENTFLNCKAPDVVLTLTSRFRVRSELEAHQTPPAHDTRARVTAGFSTIGI